MKVERVPPTPAPEPDVQITLSYEEARLLMGIMGPMNAHHNVLALRNYASADNPIVGTEPINVRMFCFKLFEALGKVKVRYHKS